MIPRPAARRSQPRVSAVRPTGPSDTGVKSSCASAFRLAMALRLSLLCAQRALAFLGEGDGQQQDDERQ
jgi:hypothetical protein